MCDVVVAQKNNYFCVFDVNVCFALRDAMMSMNICSNPHIYCGESTNRKGLLEFMYLDTYWPQPQPVVQWIYVPFFRSEVVNDDVPMPPPKIDVLSSWATVQNLFRESQLVVGNRPLAHIDVVSRHQSGNA